MRARTTGLAAAIGLATIAVAAGASPSTAQPAALEDVTMALPNYTFTFASGYVAEDLGLWAKHGLRVKTIQISGIGAINAVISGSADFSQGGGGALTRAAARGQRLLAIANTAERNVVTITLRKELAAAAGFDPGAPIEKRAAVLRGRTIAVGAINANPHAYLLAVAALAGIGKDDMRVTAMEGNAMMAAFQNKQIDGMSNSPPWPLKPVVDGLSVVIASGPEGDPPNSIPFAYNVIMARPDTCEKRKSVCQKMAQATKEAVGFMLDHPDETIAILRKRFPNLEPNVVAAAYEELRKSTPRLPVVTLKALENSDDFNIAAGLLKPSDKLKSYDGLFTDEYVK